MLYSIALKHVLYMCVFCVFPSSFFAYFTSSVEHMEELKKQLEKECSITIEEGTKYLSSKKLEVESKKCAIETRQRNVEAVLSKVPFIKWDRKTSLVESITLNASHN